MLSQNMRFVHTNDTVVRLFANGKTPLDHFGIDGAKIVEVDRRHPEVAKAINKPSVPTPALVALIKNWDFCFCLNLRHEDLTIISKKRIHYAFTLIMR